MTDKLDLLYKLERSINEREKELDEILGGHEVLNRDSFMTGLHAGILATKIEIWVYIEMEKGIIK